VSEAKANKFWEIMIIDGANDAAVLGWLGFFAVSINGANDAVGVIVMEEELSIRVTASCNFFAAPARVRSIHGAEDAAQ
jgi:hypothetical protein